MILDLLNNSASISTILTFLYKISNFPLKKIRSCARCVISTIDKIEEAKIDEENDDKPEYLSADEVFEELEKLVKKIKGFKPDYIVGINRGGAILGGMLAKRLNIDYVYLVDVNCKKDKDAESCSIDKNLDIPEFKNKKCKVLLVDDAIRMGQHMNTVEEYLEQDFKKKYAENYDKIKLRKAVLLYLDFPGRPSTGTKVKVNFKGRITTKSNLYLPWDYKDLD